MSEIKINEKPLLSKITEEEAKKTEKKTFHPGQHVLFKRYSLARYTGSFGSVRSGQLEIPEGYQVLSIQNVVRTSIHDDVETYGVDVWLINSRRVVAEPIYNEPLDIYDYSEPGTVVETMVEEQSPMLVFKPKQ